MCIGLFATRQDNKYPCFEAMYALLANQLEGSPGFLPRCLGYTVTNFSVLACVFDLAAWTKSRNHKGWQGYHGCPTCKTKGTKEGRSAMRWPPEGGSLRTHESELVESTDAAQGAIEGLFGAKGANPLRHMLKDLTACVIDVMHTVDLGCHRDHLVRMFDPAFKDQPYSMHHRVAEVERILQETKLPIQCTRFGRDLSVLGSWKAKESRLFLLVCWPVIQHFGSDSVWEHYQLLVAAVRGLTNVNLGYEEVQEYKELLQRWGGGIEPLFGVGELKLKAHLVSAHLGDHVRRTGPCSLTSLYRFESVGGNLARGLCAANAIGQQVALRLHREAYLPMLVEQCGSDSLRQHLESRNSASSNLDATAWPGHLATRFGMSSSFWDPDVNWECAEECCRLFDNERFADQSRFHLEPFAKLIRKGDQGVTVFTSRAYEAARESCNFYCSVERDGELTAAEILTFVQIVEGGSPHPIETLAICSLWDVVATRFNNSCFVCREPQKQEFLVTPIIALHLNCVCLTINDTQYLSTLPVGVDLLQ